ncbi:hypothetical protein D3C81_2189000 [compost metagenome]
MQQETVKGQQHNNADLGLYFWIEEILHPLAGIIDPDNTNARNPKHYKCKHYDFLKTFHMRVIVVT